MDTYKVLTKIYETWGEINRISPLPSADDLRSDALQGRTSISNKQIKWLEKFQRVGAIDEDHENRLDEQEKIIDSYSFNMCEFFEHYENLIEKMKTAKNKEKKILGRTLKQLQENDCQKIKQK